MLYIVNGFEVPFLRGFGEIDDSTTLLARLFQHFEQKRVQKGAGAIFLGRFGFRMAHRGRLAKGRGKHKAYPRVKDLDSSLSHTP